MNANQKSPLDDNPQTNSSGRPPLSEKDFIQNGWSLASLPFWLWIALTAIIAALIWGSQNWYMGFLQKEKSHDPFLEVTNREFSVFLWQFPSFMRVNTSKKNAYLPGFLTTNESFDPKTAEDFVSAPPDLIFLYHTWHRLLASDFIARPIHPQEFENFLKQLPEWQPSQWPDAPKEYAQMIHSKSYAHIENLQSLPDSTLPLIVRQTFLGWKNYFMEGSQIDDLQPTFGQVKLFLDKHPHYARNDWRNIEDIHGQKVAGLNYLRGFISGTFIPDATIPKEQLAPFLKVALYNAEQAEKNH
jgi:hypothetical protein